LPVTRNPAPMPESSLCVFSTGYYHAECWKYKDSVHRRVWPNRSRHGRKPNNSTARSPVFLSKRKVASIFMRKLLKAQRVLHYGRSLRRRGRVLAKIPGLTIFLSRKRGLSSTLTASKSQRRLLNRKDIECSSRTRRTVGPNRQSFSFPGAITGRYHFHSMDARGEIAQTVSKKARLVPRKLSTGLFSSLNRFRGEAAHYAIRTAEREGWRSP
jgi:hypothetical protein